MLTTVPQILDFCKQEYRISNTGDDDYLRSLISLAYLNRAKKLPWKETIVQNAAFTTATSTQFYATSTDFSRLVPNSVRYGVTSTSTGCFLPVVPFEQYEYFRGSQTSSDPGFATVVGNGGSTSGKRLMLFPSFTNSGSVVNYDYYAQPSSLSSSASLTVPGLGYTVAYDVLATWAMHVKDTEGQDRYKAMARESWSSAFQEVLPTP